MRDYRYAVAVILIVATPVRSAETLTATDISLFEAFKTFCVDTGAEPQAVKAAVESAGGRLRGVPGSTNSPFPGTIASWDIIVHDRSMLVNTGTAYPSRTNNSANNSVFDFNDCEVHSLANADPSVTAIQEWVGVTAQRMTTGSQLVPDLTQYHYTFQVIGSSHALIASQAELRSAEAEGRYWGLVILRTPRGASVQLTHTLPNGSQTRPTQ